MWWWLVAGGWWWRVAGGEGLRTPAGVGQEVVQGSIGHEVHNHRQWLEAHAVQAQDVGMLQPTAIGRSAEERIRESA